MPLKQCNHSASLLVYQQDSHQCPGADSVRVISLLWVVKVKTTLPVRTSKDQELDQLPWKGLSFERIVSQWQFMEGREPMLRPQTLILFLLLPFHTMVQRERTQANRITHITINKDMLWRSLDFNSWKNIRSQLKNFMDPIHDPSQGFKGWAKLIDHVNQLTPN